MNRMGVSGRMFLLVPAYPGSPGQRIVKRFLCVCMCLLVIYILFWFDQGFLVDLCRIYYAISIVSPERLVILNK